MADGEVRLIFSAQGSDVVTAAMQLMMDTANKLKATLKGIAGADITAPITHLGEAFHAGAAGAESLGGMAQLLSGSMAALASPVGIAAASIGALVTVMGKATEVAEETFRSVRTLSAVTGQSVEETKALQEAFKLMGLESESMDRAMFRLSAEIESGGKKLAAYGIATRDTQGHLRATGEVFEDVVRKVGAIGDAAQRNAVLLQLFGRAGRELAPLFAQGGTSLDDFKKKAEELGVYTAEDQARTQELIQVKARLSEQMEHLWLNIAKAAIPVVEGFVKVLSFLVEGISAVGGLITSWVTWMATSKEAVDPLSLSVKALAASIMAVGKAIEYVQKFGKWVADRIVAPVGGAAQAEHKEGGPSGPIVTADDVNARAKLREEQLKVDLKYFQEASQAQTNSHVLGLKAQQEFLAQTLALERQKMADLAALTDDPIQKEKLERAFALKKVQIEGETRLLTLKIREAEAADAKRVIDDQLKARKDAAAEEVATIQLRRDEDLQRAERSGISEQDLISRKKDLEVNAARDAAQVKTALIAEEMAKLQTLAAQYQDNAALQREINNKLVGLAHDRAMTEIEETKQVDKAKADAAKADEARKLKEAGMFGELIRQAQEYAKQQGRSVISQADIDASQKKLATSSEQQLAAFFGGASVDPAKLEQAVQFQQQLRRMQQQGSTPGSITSAAMGEAGKTFGAGFGYEAATQAFQSGNVGMGQLLMQRAQIMEQAGMGAGGGTEGIGSELAKTVDPKLAKLKEDIGGALDKVTDKWGELVAAIPDKITRWLEAEAARN